jgi:hypothetical protein
MKPPVFLRCGKAKSMIARGRNVAWKGRAASFDVLNLATTCTELMSLPDARCAGEAQM